MNSYPANRPNCIPLSNYRHADNVAAMRENKNPHAVALGHMTSEKKAEAAKKNGQKGGNPKDF